MRQGYSKPDNITNLIKNGRSIQNMKEKEADNRSYEVNEPISPASTPPLPSLNNSRVNKVKTAAFIIVFALIIIVNSFGVSSCSINGDNYCKFYLGYLIINCVTGLAYILINIAIYFKGSETLHLTCYSVFLFDNYQSNCCEGWRGVAIALFIILITPVAFVIFVVTMIGHMQHLKEMEECRGQQTANAISNQNLWSSLSFLCLNISLQYLHSEIKMGNFVKFLIQKLLSLCHLNVFSLLPSYRISIIQWFPINAFVNDGVLRSS